MTAAFARPRLFPLTWPLLLELLLGIGIGVIGTGLAARLSDDSGAAFGLANQVFATLFILFRIIGAGVSVAVAQALARKFHQPKVGSLVPRRVVIGI